MNPWLLAAAGALVAIAVVHSVMGERRIFRPWDAHAPAGVRPFHRHILRASWHLPSLLAVGQAWLLAAWAAAPALRASGTVLHALALAPLAGGVGASGILVLWLTRGRHHGGTALVLTALLMAAGIVRGGMP